MRKRVAIIGQAFRFPGASLTQYWNDLLSQRDFVTTVDPTRWSLDRFTHPTKTHPGAAYTFAAGSIGDAAQFDAGFFGISPREAALMDPQQRLLLELGWEALENAGIKASSIAGSQCGVFIGIASSDYAYRLADDLGATDASTATGNTASIAANRLSYFFDLHGPSMAIDTACSSSLVAFHQACQSIRCGESTQAIAGGVSLHLHPYGFIVFSKASMLSPRGRCRAFDAEADGYVRSEGGGLFFLKDYDQALSDGDRILAIVSNTAVNTDGRRKTGLTMPSHKAQATLLQNAYADAGILPSDIDYLEAHGTGTPVGDPIEARALGDALGQRRPKDFPLLIGSVKSNLGHMEAASGVAGLVKVIYSIQNRIVPATIGLVKPNPDIHFDELNLSVVTQNTPLKKTGKLIIGCNSFGFGGANAHVILESPDEVKKTARIFPKNAALPLLISGKNRAALKAAASDFANFLNTQSHPALYDITYQAAFRRDWHAHRAVVFGASPKLLAEQLQKFADESEETTEVSSGVALDSSFGPAFIYSGNGSQWAGMGAQLLANPIFKKAVQEVDQLFSLYADFSLEAELKTSLEKNRYALTEIGQTALFALQVGVTQMLRDKGVAPVAVAGHSVGEVAAAWASGALSLTDAVKVIYHRSRLQGGAKGLGCMTAVMVGELTAKVLLQECGFSDQISLAAVNSARGVTVAGPVAAMTRLETILKERTIAHKRLDLDYAFHSAAMDSIEAEVIEALADIQARETCVPFYSTVAGELLAGSRLNAEYWWHNIRQPVAFEKAVRGMLAAHINVFVEVGPDTVLRGYLNDCLKEKDLPGKVIATIKRGDDSPQRILDACGQIMISDVTLDWQALFQWPGKFVELPHYPWQREAHWHAVTPESLGLLYRANMHPLLGYALQQHELTWESALDAHKQPTLADHVIDKTTVFPGAGYVELAVAAGLLWLGSEFVEIEDLEIRSPLLLSQDQSKLVRFAISRKDGGFCVVSRSQGVDEAGTLHAVGRILSQPTDILLTQPSWRTPVRKADFTGQSHHALTLAAGLSYGPAFRAIEHGWVEQNTASAVFRIPAEIQDEIETHHLHPALLDCAFQLIIQLLKDDMDRHEDVIFVPTAVKRIALRAGSATPRFAKLTLLNKTPHSLSAEVTAFDANGLTIATLNEVRFRSIRLQRNDADHLSFLRYHCIPSPLFDAAAPDLYENLNSALDAALEDSVAQGKYLRFSEEVDPLLDSLSSRFSLSVVGDIDRQHQAAESMRMTHAPFARYLLSILREDKLVEAAASGNNAAPHSHEIPPQAIWNSLVADYPEFFPLIHAVGRVGMHLPSLLRSDIELQNALPLEATYSSLSQQILGVNGKSVIATVLHDIVTQALRDLAAGQRLKVLEISEGPASFAAGFCNAPGFESSHYGFASMSPVSIEETKRLREQFPALTVHRFDDAPNNLAPTRQDVQLAILVLDFANLQYALRALQYARSRLVENGSLLILSQHPSRWMDFVLGQTPGWWSNADRDALVSRQRPLSFWRRQIEQSGFSKARLHEFAPGTNCGAYVLIAQNAAQPAFVSETTENAPRRYLLLAAVPGASSDLAKALSEKLIQQGDSVTVSDANDAPQLIALLNDFGENHCSLEGVLYLRGIDSCVDDNPQTALLRQAEHGAAIAAIAQACEESGAAKSCWVVTGQGSPDQPLEKTGAISASIANAALWGFTRTLMNEASSFAVRLVDLQDPDAMEIAVNALQAELNQPDQEQEVIIAKGGVRLVPRLQARERPDAEAAMRQRPDGRVARLSFQTPGQLRNLRWEEPPYQAPKEDELEIDVQATGLNFRDVMYALGLLPDEAIENGFAGPTLGLEFSGIVRSIGKDITDFSPGDFVVGFGPSSFSNRVTTKANAISRIPAGIGFEAAATIPSAFFTAYYALHYLARLSAGEKVLIHGAAGGVGIAAIQIARWRGAEIYATAGSDEKRDFLRLLGITHIFDSRALRFSDEILQITNGEGVDVVLNSLAGEAINRNLSALKPFGRFLELGKRDFYENTKIGLRPFRNNISYFGVDADQLMCERPELTRTLFTEVVELFNLGVLHPLPYKEFEADYAIDAFRYMQQAKQIGKIVITYRKGVTASCSRPKNHPHRLALSENAAYLITGGLSGFGLKTAERLARNGARHLILISRSGPALHEAKQAISRLTETGVNVVARACDVTDKKALSALLGEVRETLPPLKGIVHAAMTIEDGLIRNLSANQIQRVLAPKILGAQYLHELTQTLPLDFFVLFSSATTLFGNPGQGSYVAANSWIEAFAKQRLACGLPATCVSWGIIDDAGFLARNEKLKRSLQSRMGGAALHSSAALDALEAMILTGRSGDAVLEIDWQALNKFLPMAGSPKFSELALQTDVSHANEKGADDIQQLLVDLPDDQIIHRFSEILKNEVGEILRASPDKIDPTRSFYDMGLDSLMGVELATAVESRFGIRLSAMALSENPSIHKLAERILALLRGAVENTEQSAATTQVKQVLAFHAVEATDEAIAEFAQELHSTATAKDNRMIH
jgi:phthiocerol/phenolphthiocerol synthesis type-I polyketide synthase C